ncbi:hypothetical protein OpiT1DRAFT_03441 [Opitutaceae bacterium TAV1]|nr:hypothetical protein OpiT1DRAFT_03441 [Opitutaceae bacterium TAV1]
MPAPQAIFIDTGILDREHYDFGSSRIQALLTALEGQNKKLLLPHPTSQEITKHIAEQARQAVITLNKAREAHSLLRSFIGIPQSRLERDQKIQELRNQVLANWEAFKTHFEIHELDYSGVNVAEVMDWYLRVQPPFGPKDKQKEFPDAFALAALRAYATQTGETIAIVSTDNDFKKVCDSTPRLCYFPTLDTLTSELVADQQAARFIQAVVLAQAAIPQLISCITTEFPNRGFDHELDPNGDGHVEDIEVTGCEITPEAIEVIGLEDEEFTIAFAVDVTFDAHVQYEDPNSWVNIGDGDIMYLHRCSGVVADTASITCSARIRTNAAWSEALEITSFRIEEDFIQVREPAPQMNNHDEH